RGTGFPGQEGAQAVVDAPRDERGARHDGPPRDADHDRHHHELPLDAREQLAQQSAGALPGQPVVLGAVGLLLRCVLFGLGGGHRPSSWIARSSSSPVSVSMSWSRRRSSSWWAITQRYRAELAISSVWVPTATTRPPSSSATRSASATVDV